MTESNLDPFYQEETVELKLGRVCQPGEINRVFKKLGFKLYYDVYALPRKDECPDWQSDTFVNVSLLMAGAEVDAQEDCDQINLSYPLATIDSSFISEFVRVVISVKAILSGTLYHRGSIIEDPASLLVYFEECVSDLMRTWGEEPSSREVVVLIETNR